MHINFHEDEKEGIAVAMPLRREGVSREKIFWFGQLSAVVEPIAGVLGAWAVTSFEPMLPYSLGFAAGAMIYVVVEEVIPETQRDKYTDIGVMGFIIGFFSHDDSRCCSLLNFFNNYFGLILISALVRLVFSRIFDVSNTVVSFPVLGFIVLAWFSRKSNKFQENLLLFLIYNNYSYFRANFNPHV